MSQLPTVLTLILGFLQAQEPTSLSQEIIIPVEKELLSPSTESIKPPEDSQEIISAPPEEITIQLSEILSSSHTSGTSPTSDSPSTKEKHKQTSEIENQEEENKYAAWPEFLQSLAESQQKGSIFAEDFAPQDITGCCCFSKSDCITCYGEMNVASRVSWIITQGITGTGASLCHYARRSLIPLVTFGNLDKEVRDYLLLVIAILQGVGDMGETIHDYAIIKAIQSQKNLKKLEKLYKSEKQRQKLKALTQCAEGTVPKLKIHKNFPLNDLDTSLLYKLYYPESTEMVDLAAEMKRLTQLTWIEEIYFIGSNFLWTDTYPLFWFAGTALGLIQLFLIVSDLTLQDEPSVTISIIMLVIEALQYLSLSMKYDSEQKTLETYKFRKELGEIANTASDSDGDTELQGV